METTDASLSPFHPLIAEWFLKEIGTPTDVQRRLWPRIAAGEHALITAPTRSGKTLTAFLWAINQLIEGVWKTGRTRVFYVSPLAQLRRFFEEVGEPFPEIHMMTRSGDTPQADRRRM